MKKVSLFVLSVAALIGLASITNPKPKQFILNEEQAVKLFQAIEITKKGLPSSTSVSALEASQSLQSLQEIQKVISDQYKSQTDTIKPKK